MRISTIATKHADVKQISYWH